MQMPLRRRFVPAAMLMAAALLAPQTALAAAGDLDSSFDGDGLATLAPFDNNNGYAVAVHGGKIVVAGSGRDTSENADFVVARFTIDGDPDPTFGGGDGVVTTDFGGNADFIDHGLAVLPNGKILVAGSSLLASNDYRLSIARYRTNGTLDPSFGGGDGKVTRTGPGAGAYAYGVLLLPNGKFVVGGGLDPVDGVANFALWRFNANGNIDTSFGGGDGVASIDLALGYDEIWRMLLMPDGDILGGGWAEVADGDYDVALVRFNANGSIDRAFGTQGVVTLNPTREDVEYVEGMALSGSKIVIVAQGIGATDDDVVILRLKSNGARDPSFGGGDGEVIRDLGGVDEPRDLAIQDDGKIVVTGIRDDNPIVTRFNPGGGLDAAFGDGGVSAASVTGRFESMALQSDGRIAVVGSAGSPNSEILVGRFLP
ncbi:MAG: hypothetical protein QOH61_612 [Chloroflexota bacterium]|nr:hypothetical protein [Chloroflexota bacterium]